MLLASPCVHMASDQIRELKTTRARSSPLWPRWIYALKAAEVLRVDPGQAPRRGGLLCHPAVRTGTPHFAPMLVETLMMRCCTLSCELSCGIRRSAWAECLSADDLDSVQWSTLGAVGRSSHRVCGREAPWTVKAAQRAVARQRATLLLPSCVKRCRALLLSLLVLAAMHWRTHRDLAGWRNSRRTLAPQLSPWHVHLVLW